MKYVVISDVHGRSDLVDRVMLLHSDREGALFLGDGIRDISTEELTRGGRLFGGVRGNCDYFRINTCGYDFPDELFIRLAEYNVLMMHGHTHSVKSGIEDAVVYASQRGADILLYGHTHIPTERYYPEGTCVGGCIIKRPLWVMNPGSLGEHSYGLLQIRNGQVLISHGKI